MSLTIRDIPQQERPRERGKQYGLHALSVIELLAILLAKGKKGKSAIQISQELLSAFPDLDALSQASEEELCRIEGIGPVKAMQIRAALYLGRKMKVDSDLAQLDVNCPQYVHALLKKLFFYERVEKCVVLLRNVKGRLICSEIIATGSLACAQIQPRDVFHPAIRHCAHTIIFSHNHPSGDPTPSEEDLATTQSLIEAGKLLAIPLCDHIIVGANEFVSLREMGVCFE